MAEQTLPSPAARLTKPDGLPDETWYQCFSRMWGAFTALNTTVGGKAAQSQTVGASFVFKFPEDEAVRLILKCPFAWTITETTTRTEAGTATATFSIDGMSLGGTANSASTSEQSQTHSSANAVTADADVAVTFSSTSADCENLSITIKGTRTLS